MSQSELVCITIPLTVLMLCKLALWRRLSPKTVLSLSQLKVGRGQGVVTPGLQKKSNEAA